MKKEVHVSRILSTLAIGLGVWLMLSPIILDYPSIEAISKQFIIGVIMTLVAGVRLSLPHIYWPGWVGVLLSVELIIMPLHAAGNSEVIHWNATVVGLLLLFISIRSASKHPLLPMPRSAAAK